MFVSVLQNLESETKGTTTKVILIIVQCICTQLINCRFGKQNSTILALNY